MRELRGLELGYQTFELGGDVAIVGCRLKACDFGGARIVGIYGSTLDECMMEECDMRGCMVRGSRLYTCVLPRVWCEGMKMSDSKVLGCRMSEGMMRMLEESGTMSVCNVVHGQQRGIVEGIPQEAIAWG